ncbi:MAG: hypothetical protein K0Q49_1681 [Haloplasmataceae bacterium]|jgi:transposase|nr:hypothetical protein [Haloplasmataceae bacterium]
MFIRTSKSKTSNNTYVYLVESYRDKSGKPKQRVIETLGVLEELMKDDPNILEKLKQEAKQKKGSILSVDIDTTQTNSEADKLLNYGYFFLEGLYHSLKIDEFIKRVTKQFKFKYDFNEILKLLVVSRIMNPASKKETYEKRGQFFNDDFNFSLDDLYRSLDLVNAIKEDLQLHLHEEIKKQYSRDCTLVFYDVTNYYFETEHEDELRAEGLSKENKKSPIVQMGLFIDNNGIPIAYQLFRGNNHDTTTLIPAMNKLKINYSLGKVILTADKGLNSGGNLAYLKNSKNGYIVSQKIRGSKKEFINYVLDEEEYVYNDTRTFKMKSFIRERQVKVKKGNEDAIVTLEEKVLCFWSKAYADREANKRGDIEELIQTFLNNPSKYKASNSFGVKKYLKQIEIDEETGEVNDPKYKLHFDQTKYDRDKALDGYYCIITSELELSEEEIIQKYRGLWRIEESFRVMKSDLEGRPVYVWTLNHIEAHFLTCFVALVISRLLQYKLDYRYSVKRIQEVLNGVNCLPINKELYTLTKRDPIYDEIEKIFNVSLDLKYARIEEMKNYKKSIFHYNN